MTADLKSFIESRYTTAAGMVNTLNPFRVRVHGFGSTIMGADPASTGPYYVFFTRPDMNLTTKAAVNLLGIGSPTMPTQLVSLLTGGGGTGLIKLLSNTVDSYSIDDIVVDTTSVGENWEGAKLQLPKSTLNSRQDGTLQLTFTDYAGLPVTNLSRAWVDYIEHVTRGNLNPKYDTPNYIQSRILDYAISIFIFQCSPDGETIEVGSKFTGCYPTAIPMSAWPGQIGFGQLVKPSIPFHYAYTESMDSSIFYEFSTIAKSSGVHITETKLKSSGRAVFKLNFTEGIQPGITPKVAAPRI